jgi:uncharacterized alpha-E superfamily protein
MLSRIANSLFWMGRYLERSEHLARYSKVHYFSALDAPQAQNKEELLSSILRYSGLDHLYFKDYDKINELNVLFYVLLDVKNPYSIVNTINYARENARGAQDCISTELWMAINKFFHFGSEIAFKPFQSTHTYDFTNQVMEYSAEIKGLIDNTIVHNHAWNVVSLGIHIERTIQVMRIISTKLDDIKNIKKNELSKAVENYQWPILLKSAESFDMCNRFYKATPTKNNSLEFLILNEQFPKSILFNVCKAYKHLDKLIPSIQKQKNSFLFQTGKLMSALKYTNIDELANGNELKFINETLDKMYGISTEFEKEYLLY